MLEVTKQLDLSQNTLSIDQIIESLGNLLDGNLRRGRTDEEKEGKREASKGEKNVRVRSHVCMLCMLVCFFVISCVVSPLLVTAVARGMRVACM